VTEAEASLTADDPAPWKRDVEVMKGYALVRSSDAAQRPQGAEILWKYHREDVFDTRMAGELLQYEQTHGDLDKAIQIAAQFAAFPPTAEMHEQWQNAQRRGVDVPKKLKEQASELWVKKHGKTAGFDKYLDDAYLRALVEVKGKTTDPRPEDARNRVALVELFTGASCPYCLAADMALTNLERSTSPSDVIVLRYPANSEANTTESRGHRPSTSAARRWTASPDFETERARSRTACGKRLVPSSTRKATFRSPWTPGMKMERSSFLPPRET
jgi:hypothetical protein